jgi:hypothetical protein
MCQDIRISRPFLGRTPIVFHESMVCCNDGSGRRDNNAKRINNFADLNHDKWNQARAGVPTHPNEIHDAAFSSTCSGFIRKSGYPRISSSFLSYRTTSLFTAVTPATGPSAEISTSFGPASVLLIRPSQATSAVNSGCCCSSLARL